MLRTVGLLDYNKKNMGNPCAKYVSDLEFLKHMIPHHQVAIDMSKKVIDTTNNPIILYLARNITYKQTDEILFMENVLLSGIPNMASDDKQKYEHITNQFSFYYPKYSRAKDNNCGLHHFDPKLIHKGHKLTDREFLEHMIPHHDVAVAMSERLVRHSKNPTMVSFAYDIIAGQRYEIWLMKQLLNSMKIKSTILEKFNGEKSNSWFIFIFILMSMILGYFLYYKK